MPRSPHPVSPRSRLRPPVRFRGWSLLLLLLACITPALSQEFEGVEVEPSLLVEGIHMLKARGGNIVISVGEDGVLVVDDQYAPLTERVLAAIGKITDEPVRFVLNTHWHMDHTGGNENMGKAGAVTVAHDHVRERMSKNHHDPFHEFEIEASPPGALPVVTFTEEVTFHWNGDEVEVIHVPAAHTDGDSLVFFRDANVVHMGDVFWNPYYPYIDYSSGGSLPGMVAALDLVLDRIGDETIVVPGHGTPGNKRDLQAFRDMIVAVGERVREMVAAGKTLEEVTAARPTAAFDARFAPERTFFKPDRWVELLYEVVSQE